MNNDNHLQLKMDTQLQLCDLWTDPEATVSNIAQGTSNLLLSLLGLSLDASSFKAVVTLFEYRNSKEHAAKKNNCTIVCTEFWNDHSSTGSESHDTGNETGDRLSRFRSSGPYLTTVIPSPPQQKSACQNDQGAGGEKTAEAVRPIGKIEVFKYEQELERSPLPRMLSQNLESNSISSCSISTDEQLALQPTLQCLAKRLGHVITNRRANEVAQQKIQMLEDNERRLIESQNLSKIGQWELDLRTNKLYWSDEIYSIFRIDPAQFGASYEAFLDAIHPDDRAFVDNSYTNSLKTKQSYNILHRLLLPSASTSTTEQGEALEVRWVNEICRTEYDSQDNPLYSVGVIQDITDLKQAQEMDRLKSAFLANMYVCACCAVSRIIYCIFLLLYVGW